MKQCFYQSAAMNNLDAITDLGHHYETTGNTKRAIKYYKEASD